MQVTVDRLIFSLEKIANKQRTVALCLTDYPLLGIAGVLDTGEDDDCVELFLEQDSEFELNGCQNSESVERRCGKKAV